MARKKVVFVIVEGPSDDEALGAILTNFFDKNTVHVHIVHGDITSDSSIKVTNVLTKICDMAKLFARNNHFSNKDIQQIIHIVDTDGAYAPNSCIFEDTSLKLVQYNPSKICAKDRAQIVQRNEKKRAILNKLITTKNIWNNIPYRIYYMSCNLDHVLHNKQNSSDIEKEADAYAFAKRFKNDIPGFVEFISKSDFSVVDDYNNSWEYIRQEVHSLERHSNLGLCFSSALE